jgi:hypothetical protein
VPGTFNVQLLTETVRLTLFAPRLADSLSDTAEKWWSKHSAGITDISRTSNANQATVTGLRAGARFAVHVTPGRIDWFASPVIPPRQGVTWPNVGSWPDALKAHLADVMESAATYTGVHRIGLSSAIVASAADREAGYRSLQKTLAELKLELPADVSDFYVRFNRATASKSVTPELLLNRITSWGVVTLRPMSLQITIGPGTVPIVGSSQRSETFALRGELDVNSSPLWQKDLTSDQIRALVKELADLMRDYVITLFPETA